MFFGRWLVEVGVGWWLVALVSGGRLFEKRDKKNDHNGRFVRIQRPYMVVSFGYSIKRRMITFHRAHAFAERKWRAAS